MVPLLGSADDSGDRESLLHGCLCRDPGRADELPVQPFLVELLGAGGPAIMGLEVGKACPHDWHEQEETPAAGRDQALGMPRYAYRKRAEVQRLGVLVDWYSPGGGTNHHKIVFSYLG